MLCACQSIFEILWLRLRCKKSRRHVAVGYSYEKFWWYEYCALRVFRISYTTLFYDFKNTWTSCAFTNLLVVTMPIQQLIDHRVFYLFCPSRTVFLLHERSSTTVPSLAHKI